MPTYARSSRPRPFHRSQPCAIAHMQRAIDAYCADRRRGGRHGDVILIDGRHGDIARSQQRLAIDMPGAEALQWQCVVFVWGGLTALSSTRIHASHSSSPARHAMLRSPSEVRAAGIVPHCKYLPRVPCGLKDHDDTSQYPTRSMQILNKCGVVNVCTKAAPHTAHITAARHIPAAD